MKNMKRKLTLASIMLCGSVALGLGYMNGATVSASADTLDGFAVKSAALRLPDETYGAGIRFTIGLGNVTLAEGATAGVLLIPSSSLGSDDLTVGLNNADLRVVENIQWKNFADGTKEAYLHLYDVPAINYTSNIAIRAYIDHDADPQTAPIYSDVVATSVAEVADWLYNNDDLTVEELADLQSTYLTYKVVYNNDGDTTETTGIYNQKLTAITVEEKDGYTFGGWWNEAGTHEWNFAETTVSSTVTRLYAKWNPATDTKYTVKVFETTDGGKTQTDVTANIENFISSRTGTTNASVDITEEAKSIVSALGNYYSLNAESSILMGTIAADGTTELKIVVNYDEVAAARVGEDVNTLLFFDRELGVKQVLPSTKNVYTYTTDKAYGDQNGSLKISFPGTEDHNTVDFALNNYTFNDGDYIEFYVYNSTDTSTLSVMFGYSHATKLAEGEWTRVVASASWLADENGNQYFRFYGNGSAVEGRVYISKVKVYSNFADLSVATGTWNIGETEFTGAAVMRNNAPADLWQSTLYQTGNAVTMRLWNHSYAGFEATFKTNIDATSEDKYVSFTAKGADADLFTVVMFNASGSAFTGATKACLTRTEANGYTTYIFRIAKGNTVSKFRITPLGDTTNTGNGSELIISNCTVGGYSSLRVGEDANTLFFYDTRLGVDLGQMYYKSGNNHQAVVYSTEKAYGEERGSTKVEGIKYGSNGYCLYKTKGATLSAADQAILKDGDYLVFNVYSTAERKLFFSVVSNYTTTGHKLMPNTWTRIVIPASVFAGANNYYFLINDIVGGSATSTYYDLYFSKIVRCSASEVTNLANGATTDTWTVGSTSFVGAPSVSNAAAGGGVLAATEYKKPYLVNGELVITFTRAADPYINLKLASSIAAAENSEVYVTAVMYDYGRLDSLEGYINSKYKFSYVSKEDVGGGYAKVTFKCTVSAACDITNVRFDAENLKDTSPTLATQLVIKDIAISVQ